MSTTIPPSRPASFFDLIATSPKPILVDFWAAWCGPCRVVSPVIERLAKEYRGRILTVKINTDEKPHVAGHYQITAIPTIMLFANGEAVMRLQGAHPYESLKEQLEAHLPAA